MALGAPNRQAQWPLGRVPLSKQKPGAVLVMHGRFEAEARLAMRHKPQPRYGRFAVDPRPKSLLQHLIAHKFSFLFLGLTCFFGGGAPGGGSGSARTRAATTIPMASTRAARPRGTPLHDQGVSKVFIRLMDWSETFIPTDSFLQVGVCGRSRQNQARRAARLGRR
jgi:hypothetical protein